MGLYCGICGSVSWQTGLFTLSSQVSAASIFSESSELPISSTVTTPRKLIRRPVIGLIPLPLPTPTTPSVNINSPHTQIQRPSVSLIPSPPPPETTPQISVNVHGTLIRRPSSGLTSALAPASTAAVPSVQSPQAASQTVNGVIPSVRPSTEATASAGTQSRNTAQAAMAIGAVTALTSAPSSRSTLVSTPVNPTSFASVGELFAVPQSGANLTSNYRWDGERFVLAPAIRGLPPRKLTQRSEVAAILAPRAT